MPVVALDGVGMVYPDGTRAFPGSTSRSQTAS
jgi:hypothetical protein